jgi:hypothetical protein
MTLTVRAVLPGYALTRPVSSLTTRSVGGYALVNPTPIIPAHPPVLTNYRKPQSEMIYDLIEKSNPGFKDIYPLGSVTFGIPADIAVASNDPYKNDTSVVVTPVAGSGGIGKVTVKYRRIDLSVLFKNVTLKLDNYFNTTSAFPADYVPWFAAKFGISLVSADFSAGNNITSGTAYSRGPLPACLCYKGAVTILWTLGKRPITDIITSANRNLVGRLYPGGNDFSVGRKPTGEFMTLTQDATAIKTNLAAIPVAYNPAGGANANIQTICDWLNANTGYTGWNIGNANSPGGTQNIQWFRYTLPNANVPEADSSKYTSVVVIQSSADSWFTGRCLLQYT